MRSGQYKRISQVQKNPKNPISDIKHDDNSLSNSQSDEQQQDTSKQEEFYYISKDNYEQKSFTQKPIKMIEFIDTLYQKYKILNKLSQQESNIFQTEVITMLIDQNQCLDTQLYHQTVQKIGLSTFLLQILGSIMQKRNKFKNQYEMNKNIQQIANELERQRTQLTKRKKQLDKKQLIINKQKQSLYNLLQQKARQIEQKTTKNILSVQEEIKKRVKQLTLTLKSKEKEINDKLQSMKQGLKRLKQLQSQQKNIQQKLKVLQKKQKQRKARQASDKQQFQSAQQNKMKIQQLNSKISSLQELNKKLQEQTQRLNKKIKTNQMATKHYKDQTEKKMAKFNQLNEKITILEKQKTQIEAQLRECSINLQNQTMKNAKLVKEQQGMIQKLRKHQSTVANLLKQKETLIGKISFLQKQLLNQNRTHSSSIKNTTNNLNNINNNNIKILTEFEELQISKITPIQLMEQNNQNNFTEDLQNQMKADISQDLLFGNQWQKIPSKKQDTFQGQEESIIYKMKDSFYYGKGNIVNQPIKANIFQNQDQNQSTNWRLSESQEQESINTERQRKFLMRNKKESQNQFNLNTKNQKNNLNYQKNTEMFVNSNLNESKIQLFNNYFNLDDGKKDKSVQKTQSKQLISNKCSTLSANQILTQINGILHPQKNLSSKLNQQHVQCHSLNQLSAQNLSLWIKSIKFQLKHPKSIIQPLLQLFMSILQPCSCTYHQSSLLLLFSQQTVSFIQECFLKFQALTPSIQEKSIIILSRILLSYQNSPKKSLTFTLSQKYIKSLKVKSLIEKDQFILSNINFLLNYN